MPYHTAALFIRSSVAHDWKLELNLIPEVFQGSAMPHEQEELLYIR